MSVATRVAENILTLGVLFAFGYVLYMKLFKGKDIRSMVNTSSLLGKVSLGRLKK